MGRFGYYRLPNRVRHAAWKNIASVKSKNPLDGSHSLANIFFVAPTVPASARHWFPADGIGCVPFWLVVSSGANHVKSTIMIVISPKDSINKHGKTMVCVCWLPFNTCLNCLFYREKASWHFRPCFNHFQTGHPT